MKKKLRLFSSVTNFRTANDDVRKFGTESVLKNFYPEEKMTSPLQTLVT